MRTCYETNLTLTENYWTYWKKYWNFNVELIAQELLPSRSLTVLPGGGKVRPHRDF